MDQPPPAIPFPFWLVLRRYGPTPTPVCPTHAPSHAAAFSTSANAADYMLARKDTACEFREVRRSEFDAVAVRLRELGLKGICLDPTPGDAGVCHDFG